MNNFRELKVWQKSIELVKQIYQKTNSFPSTEIYGLTSQIRRAAVSIPSNIAEGAARKSVKDFDHFLSIALGSSFELETQIIIATELNYLSNDDNTQIEQDIQEVQKMIRGLQKSLS